MLQSEPLHQQRLGSMRRIVGEQKMSKPNRETLNWICNVPASDLNFKLRLKEADIPTCEAALENNCISNNARKAIEIKLRKLKKDARN